MVAADRGEIQRQRCKAVEQNPRKKTIVAGELNSQSGGHSYRVESQNISQSRKLGNGRKHARSEGLCAGSTAGAAGCSGFR